MKTTPWFEAGEQNPVRDGVYEVKNEILGGSFKYWDGCRWGCYSDIPEVAKNLMNDGHQFCFRWRGLLKESK